MRAFPSSLSLSLQVQGDMSLLQSISSLPFYSALKMVHAGQDHLEKHYADLKGKSFFPGLVK